MNDERKDSGEYYPGGRQAQGGGGSGGGGDVTPKVPVTPVDELPERYTAGDMKRKIDQLARIISGGVAALAAMVAAAQVTVQGARKDALWNDDFVVTNVTVDLGGYATTNALAAAAGAVEATAEGKLAAATNDLAGTMGGVIVSATNSLAASVGHDIAAATNAMGAATDAKLEGYARKTWVEGQGYVKGSELSGYATESWVGSQGYATRAWTETRGYLTETNLAGYATREWTEGRGYATGTNLAEQSTAIKAWVQGQGYLKGTDLGGYATESWVEGRNYATRTELGNVQAGIGPTVRAEVEEAVRDVVQERDVALRLEDMSDVPGQTNGWRWGYWIDGSGMKHNVNAVYDGTNVVGLTTNVTALVEQDAMYDYVGNEISVATNALAGQIAELIPPGMTTNDVCAIVTNEVELGYTEWELHGIPDDFGMERYGVANPVYTVSFDPLGGGVAFLRHDGESDHDVYAETHDPDATFLQFYNGTGIGGEHDITATRESQGTRNALGLARMSDLTAQGTAMEVEIEEVRGSVAAVSNEAQVVYRLFSGSNVVDEVTNYNSVVRLPSRRMYQLSESNTYFKVWDEMEQHTNTLGQAKRYTDEKLAALPGEYAPKAWSGVTSGMGVEAPAGTTWLSTPTTVIAGGYEPEKWITSGGAVWLITSKGATYDFSPSTNNTAYLNISASDGTPMFRIEKTDSYLLPVHADAVSVDGSTLVVDFDLVSSTQPYARVCTDLTTHNWAKEEDGIPAALSTVTWTQTSTGWRCRLSNNTGGNSLFGYFEYLQEGGTKIVNEAVMDVGAGILCTDGVHKVRPVYNNGAITWEVVQ